MLHSFRNGVPINSRSESCEAFQEVGHFKRKYTNGRLSEWNKQKQRDISRNLIYVTVTIYKRYAYSIDNTIRLFTIIVCQFHHILYAELCSFFFVATVFICGVIKKHPYGFRDQKAGA